MYVSVCGGGVCMLVCVCMLVSVCVEMGGGGGGSGALSRTAVHVLVVKEMKAIRESFSCLPVPRVLVPLVA